MKRSEIKRRPLSDTVLATLEPEETEYREHDSHGLYFRVSPNGNKSWSLRYKKPNGKWSWTGLGRYPIVSAAQARKRAVELKGKAHRGEDIAEAARTRAQAIHTAQQHTFECLAEEWLIARRPSWTDKTYRRAESGLKTHVYPALGRRPFASIHPMEWMDVLRAMEKQGIFETLRNVRRHCREIYDLARVTGRIAHNPVEGLSRFLQSKPHENFVHVDLEELPQLLQAIRYYPHSMDVGLGLRILLLTAARPSELREAPWDEFDLRQALWTIPGERMKNRRAHTIPLSRQAVEALKQLKAISGAYPLLLPGRNDRKKPRSDMVFSMALRRLGYAGRQTAHGFRHIASTILRDNDFPRDHVEAQLSHVEGGVSGVYNKANYLTQRREMMQWYADYLDSLEASAPPPAKPTR